ncbi:hypothetical protein AU193_13820 [Mycobacterium sp. GA-1285]|uniref:YceI family protein n=1 Tax=Mycobacterium sp. GA-1285 TaxID=1772282 RepID=UPI000749F621|nr:YceI family protein [Mycobacterium sp. GA-1285]KUI21634.1 hypothetical protein AU193_13820 [Mycobacterium sp. GA-1285]
MVSLSELFSDPASTGTWTLDPSQSTIAVRSKSMWGLVPVKGRFTEFTGDGQLSAPQTISGHLEIKAASLRTGIRKRDEHMRSADFFEAENYPEISVLISGADAIDGDTIDLRAELTIKGRTKPLTLRTKVTPVGDGGMRLVTEATVDRHDFGVDGNLVGMIGNKATISGDLVFRHTR